MPNGIPTHDTFWRVFRALDPEQFERLMGALRVIAPVLGRSLPLAPVPAQG